MTLSRERRVRLVRHGETEGNSSVRFHGRNDVPLSDTGRAQIRALVPLLSGCHPATVWHSPLSRASESAALLCRGLHLEDHLLRVHPDLAEVHFGRWEGWTEAEIAERDPHNHALWQKRTFVGFPEGETRAGFAARVTAAIDHILEQEPGEFMVVAHRGVVRHLLRRLLAYAPDTEDTFAVPLASVTTLLTTTAGWELLELGRLP